MDLPLELELAIQAAPDDRAAYSVAADWWQQAGSPLGELVALSLVDDDDAITDRVIELKSRIVPPEIRTLSPATLEWRWGVVHGVHMSSIEDPSEPRMLRDLLASPLVRFVQKLVVDRGGQRVVDAIFDATRIEPRALRCLRTLMLFMDREAPAKIDLDRLSAIAPGLRRLVLRLGTWTGALALPNLIELTLVGDPQPLLERARLPKLDTLAITDLGEPDRMVPPERYPALRWVQLTTSTFDDRWQRSQIAPQLEQLDRFDVTPGAYTTRVFVIDRRRPAADAALVAVAGRGDFRPGTAIPLDKNPFTIGGPGSALVTEPYATGHYAVIRRHDRWWIDRASPDRYFHINGHHVASRCPLRSMDEIAINDHVFRFIEGGDALEVRARYSLGLL